MRRPPAQDCGGSPTRGHSETVHLSVQSPFRGMAKRWDGLRQKERPGVFRNLPAASSPRAAGETTGLQIASVHAGRPQVGSTGQHRVRDDDGPKSEIVTELNAVLRSRLLLASLAYSCFEIGLAAFTEPHRSCPPAPRLRQVRRPFAAQSGGIIGRLRCDYRKPRSEDCYSSHSSRRGARRLPRVERPYVGTPRHGGARIEYNRAFQTSSALAGRFQILVLPVITGFQPVVVCLQICRGGCCPFASQPHLQSAGDCVRGSRPASLFESSGRTLKGQVQPDWPA
jgi:hypothetical protein